MHTRESQLVPPPDGPSVHLVHGDAVLHARHGRNEAHHPLHIVTETAVLGAQQVLVATQSAQHGHIPYIRIGVVLGGRRPPADDVPYIIRPSLLFQPMAIRVEYLPCRPIAVSHGGELHESLVGLHFPCTLPLVGRVTDIQWMVVSYSSFHL